MTGQFIVSTRRGPLRGLSYQGIFATERYPQLVSLIQSRLTTEHANLLAEPISDPSQDTIDWYAKRDGVIRRLVELPHEKQTEIQKGVTALLSDIKAYAEELYNSKDRHKELSGRILLMAIQYPDTNNLYLVGEQPVIICWGFSGDNKDSQPEDLVRGGDEKRAVDDCEAIDRHGGPQGPPDVPPEEVERNGPPAPPVTPVRPETPPDPPVPSTPLQALKRFKFRWSWLALFFAILGLLSLLFRCSGQYGLPGLGPGCHLNTRDNQPGCSSQGTQSTVGENIRKEQEREDALRQEIEKLRSKLNERLAACPSSTQERPEQNIVIPKDAAVTGKVDFLQGCWLCETGLVNSRTGEDLTVKFCFDENGKGEQTVAERDDNCIGAARAKMESGRLIIDAEKAQCGKSGAYISLHIECRQGDDDHALCEGHSSPERWNAQFKRIGRSNR